jgi:DNA (cytosine-5)-methyltransferase 1
MRFVKDLKPRTFIIENVPGLAFTVHREALDFVLGQAAADGYTTEYAVLNAANFGVPQVRERLFIVGWRDRHRTFRFPSPTHAENPGPFSGLSTWITAGDAIGDLDTEENAPDTGHRAGGRHGDLLRLVPPGENYLFFTAERGYPDPIFKWRSRYWSFLLKLSPTRPSWTVQARRSNNMGPFHWRNRILRIEEIKRLQSFPDQHVVLGTVENQWRQIGNAVPPLLAHAVAAELRIQLLDAELQATA